MKKYNTWEVKNDKMIEGTEKISFKDIISYYSSSKKNDFGVKYLYSYFWGVASTNSIYDCTYFVKLNFFENLYYILRKQTWYKKFIKNAVGLIIFLAALTSLIWYLNNFFNN